MTIRIIHEGRGWSLYVNGKRRLYEESFGGRLGRRGLPQRPELLALL